MTAFQDSLSVRDDGPAAGLAPGWWRGDLPVLRLAVWFGLVAGLCELVFLVVRVALIEGGAFLRSPQFVWMVPVSDVALFLAAGLCLGPVVRFRQRAARALVVGTFLMLAFLSWLLLVRGLHSIACVLIAAGVARQVSPAFAAHWRGFLALVRTSTPALAGVLVALVGIGIARDWSAGPKSAPGQRADSPTPNVLMVVLDTVRADRLSLYGYRRETTPHLARLARRGVRFDRARSAASWTLPSHANMFTGRWPHELDVERYARLDGTYPTLAEFFRDRGYATVGVVANQFFCGRESGLARGFSDYRDFPVTPGEVLRSSSVGWLVARAADRARAELAARLTGDVMSSVSLDFRRKDAAQVNREFLDWLGQGRDGRPFFAFLNYFDAHDPYLVPPGPRKHFGKPPSSVAEVRLLRDWQKLDYATVGASAVTLASDAYDDCIAALDRELGKLFDELDRRGVLDRTVVVVTADHGEQFGEHGGFRHGVSLYDPEVHVPLVVLAPSGMPAGRVVRTPVSLRNLPATIIDLAGRREATPFPGTSLVKTVGTQGTPEIVDPEPPLSELRTLVEPTRQKARTAETREALSALAERDNVYIRHERGKEELYDIETDPAEARDMSDSHGSAPLLARFRQVFDRVKQRPVPARKVGPFPRPSRGAS